MILALSIADTGDWLIGQMAGTLRAGAASRGYIDLADLTGHHDPASIETYGPAAFARAAAPLPEVGAPDRDDPAIAALEARTRQQLRQPAPANRRARA